jgi:hypothetical protein
MSRRGRRGPRLGLAAAPRPNDRRHPAARPTLWQAFVEYDSMRPAIAMISYFVGNADPPRVRPPGRPRAPRAGRHAGGVRRGGGQRAVPRNPLPGAGPRPPQRAPPHLPPRPTPFQVRNKTVYLQYSTRQDIGGGTIVTPAAAAGPTPVVVATLDCPVSGARAGAGTGTGAGAGAGAGASTRPPGGCPHAARPNE